MSIKSLRLALLLSAALPLASLAASSTASVSSPQSDYDRAVKSYIDAASEQLTAVRAEVDLLVAGAKDDSAKERLEKVAAGFARCDKVLAELKKAGPADFDRIKSEFELTRNKLLKELDSARKI
ncbi:MAG TPA: hypothetical protein VHO24_20940 [Opitutaceae bacterium]|nr:hypothetical protein [Opitutaceae bacterium]